jgi:hypothetical protein
MQIKPHSLRQAASWLKVRGCWGAKACHWTPRPCFHTNRQMGTQQGHTNGHTWMAHRRTCSTKPIWRRTALVRRCPLTVMAPAVCTYCGTRPPIALSSVVFPDPLGPYRTATAGSVSSRTSQYSQEVAVSTQPAAGLQPACAMPVNSCKHQLYSAHKQGSSFRPMMEHSCTSRCMA